MMAWFIALHGPNHGVDEANRFLLAVDADREQIARALDDAQPGQFVKVPIEYPNQIHTPGILRVQPHLYAAWTIYEAEVGPG
jgi:hypothetical protein